MPEVSTKLGGHLVMADDDRNCGSGLFQLGTVAGATGGIEGTSCRELS